MDFNISNANDITAHFEISKTDLTNELF